MTEISQKQKENFTSYLKCLDSAEESSDYDFYSPALLNGELEAARAKNVHLCVAQKIKAQSKKKKSKQNQNTRTGLLIITNFRLSFVAFESDDKNDKSSKKNTTFQENTFLGLYDITLSNIDEIYAYTDKKQKLVQPNQKNASKIDAIRIVCKNFRMLTFTFEDSEVGKGKYIADALLSFAFPTRHTLLFMYQFKEKYFNTTRSIRTFRDEHDWTQELERCGISSQTGAWRVLSNEYPSSESALPQHFVVPRKMTDSEYFKICDSFRCKRGAFWVWAIGNASLVRMADLLPDLLKDETNVQKIENLMLEHVVMCSDKRIEPKIMELTKGLPSIQDVYQSYLKLRVLCVPESDRELTIQDQRFYTLLDKTSWLLYVSLCIKMANDAAKFLRDGASVVLQENDGRDMSCLVSSVVQVLLDPFCRTITGFQVLIQKEWVALGHPFSDRMGHIHSKQIDRSPVFLLFLDCIWQILQQFPESFEFTETFLTTIWDCVYLSVFDTFQFNCEYDRYVAMRDENLVSRPVWDWGEIFNDKDIALFSNPLYKKPQMSEQEIENHRKSKLPPNAMKLPGMDILAFKPKQPKQRFSLQPNKSIDSEAKLLLPSQLMNHQNQQPSTMEQPKIEKLNISNDQQQPAEKYLTPSHQIRDLEIFQQCYFRWMPILEIHNGGAPQIDLFNRMILSNIHKLQKAIETGNSNLSELQNDASKIPNVNSYFPFSMTDGGDANTNLHDILIDSSDIITEGSLFEFE